MIILKYCISGFFRVSQNLRKWGKHVAFLICVSHFFCFCNFKSDLQRIIQDMISVNPVFSDLKEIAEKAKNRLSRKLPDIRYVGLCYSYTFSKDIWNGCANPALMKLNRQVFIGCTVNVSRGMYTFSLFMEFSSVYLLP